jgi:hypothetical protein
MGCFEQFMATLRKLHSNHGCLLLKCNSSSESHHSSQGFKQQALGFLPSQALVIST